DNMNPPIITPPISPLGNRNNDKNRNQQKTVSFEDQNAQKRIITAVSENQQQQEDVTVDNNNNNQEQQQEIAAAASSVKNQAQQPTKKQTPAEIAAAKKLAAQTQQTAANALKKGQITASTTDLKAKAGKDASKQTATGAADAKNKQKSTIGDKDKIIGQLDQPTEGQNIDDKQQKKPEKQLIVTTARGTRGQIDIYQIGSLANWDDFIPITF
ncbi:MAG: hypothetical protein EZS28_055042, partial [Streblomastix strix]